MHTNFNYFLQFSNFLLEFLFYLVCVCARTVCICLWRLEEAMDFLVLELLLAESCSMWMLGPYSGPPEEHKHSKLLSCLSAPTGLSHCCFHFVVTFSYVLKQF